MDGSQTETGQNRSNSEGRNAPRGRAKPKDVRPVVATVRPGLKFFRDGITADFIKAFIAEGNR